MNANNLCYIRKEIKLSQNNIINTPKTPKPFAPPHSTPTPLIGVPYQQSNYAAQHDHILARKNATF